MRYLMITALSFCAGAALALPVALRISALPPVIAGVFLLFTALLLLLLSRPREIRLILITLGLGTGLLFSAHYHAAVTAPSLRLADTCLEHACLVTDYPRNTERGMLVDVRLTDEAQAPRAQIWFGCQTSLKPGDIITAEVTLSDSAAEHSWYGYADGVFLSGKSSELLHVTPCTKIPLRYLPKAIAHRLEESLTACFPEDMLGYAIALTTGNRSLMDDTEKALLQRAGIYHALALSGMHMSVLMGCLTLFRRRKRLKALLGIPLCIAFAVITGASPSVVRAAVLQFFLLSAGAFRRESDAPTSLSAAALVLIAQNPWTVMSWGAQLSFAAVSGLMLFGNRMFAAIRLKPKNRLLRKLSNLVAAAAATTISAMLLTVPLMALEFGYVSLISPVTNLLCGGITGFCFAGSLLTALLGLISPLFGTPVGSITAWGFRYISFISRLLARIPFSAAYTSGTYMMLWLVLLYLILSLMLWKPDVRRLIPLCCISCCFSLCLLLTTFEGTATSFSALNVGQGQCLLFRSDGGTVMVDCGSTREAAGQIAADYLAALGEPDLDLLILTHYDEDHTNGVTALLTRTAIRRIALPEIDSQAREEIEAAAMAAGTDIYRISADTTVRLGDGALQLLFTGASGSSVASGSNDNGLAVLSSIPGLQVLITGDMDAAHEKILIANHKLPDLDILVAGHHGSKTSTSAALLTAVTPDAAVISVGENSYGHPSDEVLSRLGEAGITVYRTDEADYTGAVTLYPSH